MNAVKGQVTKLVEVELAAANEKYPAFHSAHEGYAVILEEVEEAEELVEDIQIHLKHVWRHVRRDGNPAAHVEHIRGVAMGLACEAIQIAAMAQKYLDMEDKHEAV